MGGKRGKAWGKKKQIRMKARKHVGGRLKVRSIEEKFEKESKKSPKKEKEKRKKKSV